MFNENLALLSSSYFPLAYMFYGRVDISLDITILYFAKKAPPETFDKVFSTPLSFLKITGRKLDTPTLVSIITSKMCLVNAF